MRIPDLTPDIVNQTLFQIVKIVIPGRTADAVKKIPDHLRSVRSAFNLRMELHAVKRAFSVLYGRIRAGGGSCRGNKALRQNGNLIGMAHQTDLFCVKPAKKRGLRIHAHFGFTVFTGSRRGHCAADRPGEQLRSVANTEHGDAHVEDRRIAVRGIALVNAVGAAGQDHSNRRNRADFLRCNIAGFYDRIDTALPYTARNQFLILSSEIKDQNNL